MTRQPRDPTLQAKEELEVAARAERENAEAQEALAAMREAEACRAAADTAEAVAVRRTELAALRAREEAESGAEAEKRFRRCGW